MKLYHYHLYDYKGRPVISVCLVEDEQSGINAGRPVYSRGVAICHAKDYGNLKNKRGKEIARGRALKAASTRRHDCEMLERLDILNKLDECRAWGLFAHFYQPCATCKSQYDVTLTTHEKEVIAKVEQRRQERAERKQKRTPRMPPCMDRWDVDMVYMDRWSGFPGHPPVSSLTGLPVMEQMELPFPDYRKEDAHDV